MSGLRAVAVALLGDDAEVVLHPTVTFGAETSVSQTLACRSQGGVDAGVVQPGGNTGE